MVAKHKSEPERKHEILQAAARCIARKGYEATRLDDIAKESGLSKGAIYWYFESKREILLSLIDHWGEQWEAVYGQVLSQDMPVLRKLDNFGKLMFTMLKLEPGLNMAQMELWAGAPREPEFKERLEAMGTRFLEETIELIKQGMASGELRNDIDPETVAVYLMGLMDGLAFYAMGRMEWFDPDKMWPKMFKVICAGIANPEKPE